MAKYPTSARQEMDNTSTPFTGAEGKGCCITANAFPECLMAFSIHCFEWNGFIGEDCYSAGRALPIKVPRFYSQADRPTSGIFLSYHPEYWFPGKGSINTLNFCRQPVH